MGGGGVTWQQRLRGQGETGRVNVENEKIAAQNIEGRQSHSVSVERPLRTGALPFHPGSRPFMRLATGLSEPIRVPFGHAITQIIHVSGTKSRKFLVGLRKPRREWFARRALEAGPAKRPKAHQGLGLLVTTLHRHESSGITQLSTSSRTRVSVHGSVAQAVFSATCEGDSPIFAAGTVDPLGIFRCRENWDSPP